MTQETGGNFRNKKGFLGSLRMGLERRRIGELMVQSGLITPQELKFALAKQKEIKAPLGQIFLEYKLITRRQLSFVLARQYALRTTAATILFCASLGGFAGKKARADSIKDVPGQISLVFEASAAGIAPIQSYPGLFGTSEKRSGNLSAFTKWTGMFDRFDRELQEGKNQAVIADWKKNLTPFKGLSLRGMAEKVNALMNEKPYILDNRNWGKSDYWSTPVEFLKRGGDCEDFAIAKYTALRMLGVPENRMRVAIVHDTQKNIPHAVLAVYTDQGTVILDNQNKGLVNGDRLERYRPIFSINRTAWWLHNAGGATQVASAR